MEGIVEVVHRGASHTLREEKEISPIRLLTVLPNHWVEKDAANRTSHPKRWAVVCRRPCGNG
jgi:hypothetical protein